VSIVYQSHTAEGPAEFQNDTKEFQNDSKEFQNDTAELQNDTKELQNDTAELQNDTMQNDTHLAVVFNETRVIPLCTNL